MINVSTPLSESQKFSRQPNARTARRQKGGGSCHSPCPAKKEFLAPFLRFDGQADSVDSALPASLMVNSLLLRRELEMLSQKVLLGRIACLLSACFLNLEPEKSPRARKRQTGQSRKGRPAANTYR